MRLQKTFDGFIELGLKAGMLASRFVRGGHTVNSAGFVASVVSCSMIASALSAGECMSGGLPSGSGRLVVGCHIGVATIYELGLVFKSAD
ncbi:hypothetical protein C9I56_02750 [Paraburkholderia caribensis]|nr:hypothetical protein C9I56_02750 [Paraburkholderia caribensis]